MLRGFAQVGGARGPLLASFPQGLEPAGAHREIGSGQGLGRYGVAGSYTLIPLLSSSSLLLQSGTGAPCPAFLLAPNQFFLLWWPTAAPCSTTTAATTVHGSHCMEKSDKRVRVTEAPASPRNCSDSHSCCESFPNTALLSGAGLRQQSSQLLKLCPFRSRACILTPCLSLQLHSGWPSTELWRPWFCSSTLPIAPWL